MRVMIAVFTLFLGIVGAYLVGAGMFLQGTSLNHAGDLLLRPFLDPTPLSSIVLALSVLLAFFSLTMAIGSVPSSCKVQASHIFMWGSLFSVLTAAGFAMLLVTLWRQGTGSRELGLVFVLAAVQSCLALVLGGGAVLLERRLRHVTVPIFLAGVVETLGVGAVMAYGLTV